MTKGPATSGGSIGAVRSGGALGFLKLALLYWSTTEGKRGGRLAVACLMLIGINLLINLGLNWWNRWFFDMLENREGDGLPLAVLALMVLVGVGAGAAVSMVYATMTLQLEWRSWITDRLIAAWSRKATGGEFQLKSEHSGSPEYRLAQDVRLATEPLVELSIGFINSALLGAVFVSVLISVGGPIVISFRGLSISIPAYLALAACIYAAALSLSLRAIGGPLVARIAAKNEAESQFLFELTSTAEDVPNAEHRDRETRPFETAVGAFDRLATSWRGAIRQYCRVTWLTNGHTFFAPILPLLLVAPKFISGELSLGAVMQITSAFAIVLGALNWLSDNYLRYAEWKASAERVDELHTALSIEGA